MTPAPINFFADGGGRDARQLFAQACRQENQYKDVSQEIPKYPHAGPHARRACRLAGPISFQVSIL